MKLKAIGGVAVVLSMCAALPCRAQVASLPEGPLPSRAFEPTALTLDDQPSGDGRRTMGAFPRNLGRNFVGVFSGQNLTPFAVGLAATASARAFDDHAQRAMRGAPARSAARPARPWAARTWPSQRARRSWPAASRPRGASAP